MPGIAAAPTSLEILCLIYFVLIFKYKVIVFDSSYL